jgi:hypothetical protein
MNIINKLKSLQENLVRLKKPTIGTVLNFRNWKDKYHLYIIAWHYKVLPTDSNDFATANSNYYYFSVNAMINIVLTDFLDNKEVQEIVKDYLKNESDIRRQILNTAKTPLIKEAIVNTFDMVDQERELNK